MYESVQSLDFARQSATLPALTGGMISGKQKIWWKGIEDEDFTNSLSQEA